MSTRMQMHACTLRTLAVFMYIPLKILLRITHLIIAKGFWGGGGGKLNILEEKLPPLPAQPTTMHTFYFSVMIIV